MQRALWAGVRRLISSNLLCLLLHHIVDDADFRDLQRRADLHGVDVPIVDQLVSQLAADAQHLPKLFDGHDVGVFREHHLIKLSELTFLHRLEPPLSVLKPHFCGGFCLLPLIRIVPAPESHHGVSLLWCARSCFGKSWRHLLEAYSKSFKDKTRRDNPEENWVIFKDVHEPIIDRDTFEQVQKKIVKKTKRRAPKPQNGEKSIFSDFLYCADCGHKLWYHINTINKNICYFSCSNYVKDYRGTCPARHYVRADAIEQVVKLELRRLAQFLQDDELQFANLLESKTNQEIAAERKQLEGELQKAIMRTETVSRLYKKAFEKNAEGLLSDEEFLQVTHEYDEEQLALKTKIPQLRERIAESERRSANKDKFIAAIRRFMQMDKLTAPLLRELIDRIEVYETQGVGKNRTQKIVIHYRFVGYIDIPEAPLTEHYVAETRQGVAVEYIPA